MDLEKLLIKNDCHAVTHQIRESVLEYLAANETINGKGILFTERLLSIADDMLRYQPGAVSSYLTKIFTFSEEGLAAISSLGSRKTDKSGEEGLCIMKARISSYAENAAKILFQKTKDLRWAKQRYTYALETARLLEGIEDWKSSHAYSFAADAALLLWDCTRDVDWRIKVYEARIKSGEVGERTNIPHSTHSYSIAADIAMKLWDSTGDPDWALKVYNARIKSAEIGKKVDAKHSTHSYSFAADAAINLFELTSDLEWLTKAYEARINSAKIGETADTKHSMYSYRHAGDIARSLFEKTRNLSWMGNAAGCYQHFLDSAMKPEALKNLQEHKVKAVFELRDWVQELLKAA